MNVFKKCLKVFRIILSIGLVIYGFNMAVVQWYFTVDDRCAVDNLQFVADQAREAGIKTDIDTKGINRLKYPTPIALLKLSDLTSNWTTGYLSGMELVTIQGEKRDYKNYDVAINPYNTMSRLNFIYSNEIDQKPYDIIKYHIAITDPDTELSYELLSAYTTQVQTMEDEMIEEYKEYYTYYTSRFTVGFMFMVAGVLINIAAHLGESLKKKSNSEE